MKTTKPARCSISISAFEMQGEEELLDWLDRIILEAETVSAEVERSKCDAPNLTQTYSNVSEKLMQYQRLIPVASAKILYELMDSGNAGKNIEDFANEVVARLRRFSGIMSHIQQSVSKQLVDKADHSEIPMYLLN